MKFRSPFPMNRSASVGFGPPRNASGYRGIPSGRVCSPPPVSGDTTKDRPYTLSLSRWHKVAERLARSYTELTQAARNALTNTQVNGFPWPRPTVCLALITAKRKPGSATRLYVSWPLASYAASTTRTSNVTLSQFRTAPKIAARLSMLGLPLGESMRCRLLLGL